MTKSYNTSIKLTEGDIEEMKHVAARDSRVFPNRDEVIDLCERFGFYEPRIAKILRRKEIP